MKRLILLTFAIMEFSCIYGQFLPQTGLNQQVFLPSGTLSCPTGNWKLVFFDEFNDSQLDATKWVTYFPYAADGQCEYCRTHGNEGQIYKDDNVIVSEGTIKLIAKQESALWFGQTRQYTSGMIHSTNSFKFYYGKIEIRAKIPYGMGFWPAFWLYGDEGNEIDIFEFGCQQPSKLYTNVHTTYNNQHYDWSEEYNGTNFSNNFHNYSVEWEPNQIIFKVDGNEIRKIPRYWNMLGQALYCNASIASGAYIENLLMPDNPLNIILNLAIGVTGVTAFTDSPNSSTVLPNQFEIDYVRVYQRNPQSGFYDLCNGRGITGPTVICSESYTYTFNGPSSNLVWSVSPNLIVDNINNNTITVRPSTPLINETANVYASDALPCTKNSFTKIVWVGTPTPAQPVVYYNSGKVSVCKGQTHTVAVAQTTGVTSYQWRIIYPDGFSWPLESTTRTATFCIDDTGWYSVAVKQKMDGCIWSSEATKRFSVESCGTSTTCSGGGLIPRLIVAPNPASEEITISEVEPANDNVPWVLRLMSGQGAVMVNVTAQLPKTLDISGLQPGLYVLHTRRGNYSEQQVVVID